MVCPRRRSPLAGLAGLVGLVGLAGLVGLTPACASEPEFICPEASDPGPPGKPKHLCAWDLFVGSGATQEPAPGVYPYRVIANLFTDDADKHRLIRLPEGERITVGEDGRWEFPVGTVLVKSFSYPRDARDPELGFRLLETRLLVREADGWEPHVYRWDQEQDEPSEATRYVAGTRIDVAWIDQDGAPQAHPYRIPSLDDCVICHGGKGETLPLGPRTPQMDRDYDFGAGPVNQIDHFVEIGVMDPPATAREPLVDPFGDAPLEERARAYLDSNCAHCHREGGEAQSSGLWLERHVEDPLRLGICKPPVAAGRGAGGLQFDIVPGDPERSIFVFRMNSDEPDIMMPELGGLRPDPAGAALIRAWIAAMEPTGCGDPGG